MKLICRTLLSLVILLAGAGLAQSDYPEEPIILVIQASAGGGSDLFARTFANTVEKEQLLPVPVVPENRPGASGAIAFAYVAERAGDPYFDEFVVAVREDSEFQTLEDVTNAAAANPNSVLAAGTQLGSSDSIVFHLLEKETGADFNYLVFDGGDEVNGALLGGNADVAVGNPGDFVDLYEAGRVRLLSTMSEERLASLPDVPTAIEQGFDVTYVQNRGFVAPALVPTETIEVLEKTIQAYMETDAWNEYVTSKGLSSSYKNSAEFKEFLEKQTEVLTEVLTEMGVIGE